MNKRKINIEFIRVFAAVMVIVIHISNIYLVQYHKIGKTDFLTATCFNSVARVCVPLFFMISGIFLLKAEYDRKKYVGRILRFIGILLVWSFIYYLDVYDFKFQDAEKIFVKALFNPGVISRHLWFMYAIIGIYIALPFIQNMCKNMTREQENLFLILWLVLSGLDSVYVPIASRIVDAEIAVKYPVPIIYATYYLGYFVSGHILYERFKNKKGTSKDNILCVAGYLAATILSIVITYFMSLKEHAYFDAMTWYRGILVIVAAFSLFVLIVRNEGRFKCSLILKMSELSFGIYLVHYLFVNEIMERWDVLSFQPLIFIPLATLGVYVLSFVICWVLKRIPGVKQMI